MNAVGIDVSKGKSMMMALQPMNNVVLKPREYPHAEKVIKFRRGIASEKIEGIKQRWSDIRKYLTGTYHI